MAPYYDDGERKLYLGDAWKLAAQLEPESVDCVVTSPPYWGKMDYGVDGQFGLEKDPREYISRLVRLFVLLRPSLKPSATLWINMGDTYGGCSTIMRLSSDRKCRGGVATSRKRRRARRDGWNRPKQRLLIPHRFAISLEDEGFICRNDLVWDKGRPTHYNPNLRDRYETGFEYVFLFTINEHYYFDFEPGYDVRRWPRPMSGTGHLTPLPVELPEEAMNRGCPKGGLVLDPFAGSGTVLAVAKTLDLRATGFELSPEYADLIVARIE